jgi:kinesin family protein C2/C3
LLAVLQALGDELALATTRYRKEMAERKKLHNMIQELKGNIRVFMRCRPPTRKELEQFGEF